MPYPPNFMRRRGMTGTRPRLPASALPGGVNGQSPAGDAHTKEGRSALLARITAFLTDHDLAVTGANLALVGNALSGTSARLADVFTEREASGEPIDQRWLDTIMRLDPETGGRMAELEKLIDKLEYSLLRFAQTTRSAADETSGHRGALGAQIEAMAGAVTPDGKLAEVDRVIEMSRAMLERIEQVEQAMEKSQAETQELRENLARARMEADVDHLTRLPNRRAFERRFAAATEEARAGGTKLCVAFCDVDRFKSINDTHGHDAGDRILCAIAGTLSAQASDTCFVARHGGEEFVVLLEGLDKDAAWRKIDGMRRAQAAKQLLNRETGKPFGKVTFSAGIAEVTENADARSALSRADAALYEAKKAGRNCVIAV